MSERYCFNVADFSFSILLFDGISMNGLLPSFKDFIIDREKGKALFVAKVKKQKEPITDLTSASLMEEDQNDMGILKLYRSIDAYILDVQFTEKGACHRMIASPDFSEIDIYLAIDDFYKGSALCSMIRFAYSQAILSYHAISIHAAAVVHDNKGYLFLGRSGTGKSTHAQLWIEHIKHTELLNDDNPTLLVKEDGTVWVYGTPWSGKTPCYRHRGAEVGGIVRLQQSSKNGMTITKGLDAFTTIFPSCMVIRRDSILSNFLYTTIEKIVQANIHVGNLHCLPDKAAAEVCYQMIIK
jgi:hypothetical protein